MDTTSSLVGVPCELEGSADPILLSSDVSAWHEAPYITLSANSSGSNHAIPRLHMLTCKTALPGDLL